MTRITRLAPATTRKIWIVRGKSGIQHYEICDPRGGKQGKTRKCAAGPRYAWQNQVGEGITRGFRVKIDKSGQAAIGNTKRTVASYRFNLGHTVDYRTEGQAKRRRGTFFNATGRGTQIANREINF
jgi:hypothetical protein